eukprot:4321569-Pleurochrysis_carterae.AAC.5
MARIGRNSTCTRLRSSSLLSARFERTDMNARDTSGIYLRCEENKLATATTADKPHSSRRNDCRKQLSYNVCGGTYAAWLCASIDVKETLTSAALQFVQYLLPSYLQGRKKLSQRYEYVRQPLSRRIAHHARSVSYTHLTLPTILLV